MTNKVKVNIIPLGWKKQRTKFKKDNCWFCDIVKEKKYEFSEKSIMIIKDTKILNKADNVMESKIIFLYYCICPL